MTGTRQVVSAVLSNNRDLWRPGKPSLARPTARSSGSRGSRRSVLCAFGSASKASITLAFRHRPRYFRAWKPSSRIPKTAFQNGYCSPDPRSHKGVVEYRGSMRTNGIVLSFIAIMCAGVFPPRAEGDDNIQKLLQECNAGNPSYGLFHCLGYVGGIGDMMGINGLLITKYNESAANLGQFAICPGKPMPTYGASALTQTEGTGNRLSLARMASAGLVHTKGLGSSLCSLR